MDKRQRREYWTVGIFLVLLGGLLLSSFITARAQVRDELRKQDLTNLKHAVEMYNNAHGYYPAPPSGTPGCTRSDDRSSWLFNEESPLLKEQHLDAIPHDVREQRGHIYTYCVTDVKDNQGLGFYLQAQFEVDQADTRTFDEDESRKFHYRILHDEETILYRICGGNEKQCQP
ncbi:MAG: hypothetical protein ACRD4B_07075 [Acidobacteriota bacterium]